MPLVSILMPTFNHERFIGEAIGSAINQTYADWELIIVDDGSTDDTWTIANGFSAVDGRIKAFRQKNKGIWRLAETYNSALSQASGEYIAILEGDDYWPPTKLETQLSFHGRDVTLSYGDVMSVTENGTHKRILKRPPFVGRINHTEWQIFALTRASAVQPVSAICSAYALKSIGGFHQDQFPAVDFPTFVRLAQQEGYVVFVTELLGFWRTHESQVTQSMGVELLEGRLRISLNHFRSLSQDKQEMLGISEAEIVASHSEGLADAYLVAVRRSLLERKQRDIWSQIKNLWRHGGTLRKLQSVYAAFAIWFGLDMEWILDLNSRLRRVCGIDRSIGLK